MVEKYNFKEIEEPFERTYRRMSNLDDMHENGIHDYMKFVKFGYGRCSDHVSKDIRSGKLNRDQGILEVKSRDHIKPKDIYRWLDYVGWTEKKFDEIADTFRDPRVWWIKKWRVVEKIIFGVALQLTVKYICLKTNGRSIILKTKN